MAKNASNFIDCINPNLEKQSRHHLTCLSTKWSTKRLSNQLKSKPIANKLKKLVQKKTFFWQQLTFSWGPIIGEKTFNYEKAKSLLQCCQSFPERLACSWSEVAILKPPMDCHFELIFSTPFLYIALTSMFHLRRWRCLDFLLSLFASPKTCKPQIHIGISHRERESTWWGTQGDKTFGNIWDWTKFLSHRKWLL